MPEQIKNVQKKKSVLSPKMDIVFQAIFGEIGSENITKDFLEKILNRKIEKITLDKNPVLRREVEEDKLGVLDIITELDGKEKCNIEMQFIDKNNIIERMLYYWAKIYTKQIKKGKKYSDLEKTIVILISNFKIKGLEGVKYHSSWKIMNTNSVKKLILTDKFELDIIELSKIKGKENDKDQLLDWLMFLEDPKSERVAQKMKENKHLKDAVDKLEEISNDERMQRIVELREKAIMDEQAIYDKGVDDGIEKGKIEGAKEREIQIAKRLLKKEINILDIMEITGLTKNEIEDLKKE